MDITGKKSTDVVVQPVTTTETTDNNELTLEQKYKTVIFSLAFWDRIFVKIVETLVSVKVWGLIGTMLASSYMLANGHITGDNWTTINSTVFGIIYAMREQFKISRLRHTFSSGDDTYEGSV